MNESTNPPVEAIDLPEDNAASAVVVGTEGRAAPTISVVLPAKSPKPCLKLCLASLFQQDINELYEVIVVVDRGDPLEAVVKREYPEVRIISCEANVGPGGARNQGIKSAQGQYIAFTDADCLCERDWLRHIVSACRENNDGPVAGWITIGQTDNYVSRASRLAELGTTRPKRPHPTPGIWGSNMCINKTLLTNVDAVFAERVYGAEEIVFLRKLPAGSGKVILTPTAQVQHLHQYKLIKSLWRMYHLGLGAGRLRKTANCRGSIFARHRWMILLLPMARMLLTAWRVVRYSGWRETLDFIYLSPLVFFCWVWYSVGFAAGASGYIEERFRRPAEVKR